MTRSETEPGRRGVGMNVLEGLEILGGIQVDIRGQDPHRLQRSDLL
jgi:hypothetical protein